MDHGHKRDVIPRCNLPGEHLHIAPGDFPHSGRTTLFVTHRLSSVRMDGRILVLKEGRLIEVGTHEELLARGGQYASMFKLQAERYQVTEAA